MASVVQIPDHQAPGSEAPEVRVQRNGPEIREPRLIQGAPQRDRHWRDL